MHILFNINYSAPYGESLHINIRQQDGTIHTIRMNNIQEGQWQYDMRIDNNTYTHIDYYYSVHNGDKVRRTEWTTQAHRIDVAQTGLQQYTIYDTWIDIPHDTYLYSSAYTQCINRREKKSVYRRTNPAMLRLKVRAPQLRGFERLILVGAHPVLGEWCIDRGIPCVEQAPNEWTCDIDAEYTAMEDLEYKFVAVKDGDEMNSPMWETGENRHVTMPRMRKGEVTEIELSQAFFEIWNVRKAGTLIPVFSLRTAGSFGVGDFGDLKRMIDWVEYTGQRLLQVLPINDSTITHTWTDSYPYSCISIFALHPQYADFRQLPELNDKSAMERFETLRQELNALPQIDYERVNNAKNEYLSILFQQEGKATFLSEDFKKWFDEEQHWLVPYAQYSYLRDTYGTAEFSTWKDHNTWNEEDRAALSNPRTKAFKQVSYYYYVQYILAKQMKSAHEYAREKRVILKGDIPIGVHRLGCDVWQEPRYFNLNGQAGAPPDDFSIDGQNWGFPTYNWDEMLKDDCLWWVRRFQNMQKYFDAYRIDHILGFFRIWEIPMPYKSGLMGQFQPSLGLTVGEIEGYGLHWDEDHLLKPCTENAWDCLFLRDHHDRNKFHPRISSHSSPAYERLASWEKDCYNRLYEDYFYRRNNAYWYKEAMKKLPRLIEATRMLVCAEDLGMIPDCVPSVINELRILSLELQSMPKEMGQQFGRPEHYPYRSVCTIDSHDMPTLRMWWDEDLQRAQNYYSFVLNRRDEAPHPLPTWLARDIMSRNLQSASMLCILSLQDWLAINEELRLADANAERINIPANPHHYWRYRMHLNIDDMLNNQRFCDDIAEMITQSGR
ncbi:MAG: 4-alpha-glucanotransferase [Prevotella sp.]|nr:4-alpha-glucanotransferase [Candidatus Prevotella equi]